MPNTYDTMRFLKAGIGSSVVGTGLTLVNILATELGVTLVYRDDNGKRHSQYLDVRKGESSE